MERLFHNSWRLFHNNGKIFLIADFQYFGKCWPILWLNSSALTNKTGHDLWTSNRTECTQWNKVIYTYIASYIIDKLITCPALVYHCQPFQWPLWSASRHEGALHMLQPPIPTLQKTFTCIYKWMIVISYIYVA